METKTYEIDAHDRKELFDQLHEAVRKNIIADPKAYQIKVVITWYDSMMRLNAYMEDFGRIYFYHVYSLLGGNVYRLDWSDDLKPMERRKKKK